MTPGGSATLGRAAGRFRRNLLAIVGAAIVALLGIMAFAGYFAAADTFNVQTDQVRLSPSATHWFGTDELGRDIFARILYGAHITLGSGLAIVLLSAVAGVPLGLASAYLGGVVDEALMRLTDVVLAFPSILLALALVAALGFNMTNIILAVSLVYAPRFARVVRAAALVESSMDYIRAAEALGCGRVRILVRHLLPNCIAPVIVLATLSLGSAILEAAGLSFLGLGAQPPLPEWGRMICDGRPVFQTHPHVMLFPGLAIALTVVAVNLVGDGLRDALDVRLGK